MSPLKDIEVISEKSSMSIGLILAIIAGTITGIITSVWWASAVSTRLGSIESYMSNQGSKIMLIEQIDSRLKMVETYGAAPTKTAVEQLSKELADIRHALDNLQRPAAVSPKTQP